MQKEILKILREKREIQQAELRRLLAVPKQNLRYNLSILSRAGLVVQVKIGAWNLIKITKKGMETDSVFYPPQYGIDAVKIYGNIRLEAHQFYVKCESVDWEFLEAHGESTKAGNLDYIVLKVEELNVTLRFYRNNAMSIYFEPIKAESSPQGLSGLLLQRTSQIAKLGDWLRWKRICLINWDTLIEKDIELENKAHESLDSQVPKGERTTVMLGRNAEGLMNPLKQEARAWLDKSPEVLHVASNDKHYQEKLVMLPEYAAETRGDMKAVLGVVTDLTTGVAGVVQGMAGMVEGFAGVVHGMEEYHRNVNLHVAFMGKITEALEGNKLVIKPVEGWKEKAERVLSKPKAALKLKAAWQNNDGSIQLSLNQGGTA